MTTEVETAPGGRRHRVNSPHSVDATAQGASIVQVGVSERIMWALVLIVLGIALAVSIGSLYVAAGASGDAQRAIDRADLAERESRLAQEDLKLLRASMQVRGLIDSTTDHNE